MAEKVYVLLDDNRGFAHVYGNKRDAIKVRKQQNRCTFKKEMQGVSLPYKRFLKSGYYACYVVESKVM